MSLVGVVTLSLYTISYLDKIVGSQEFLMKHERIGFSERERNFEKLRSPPLVRSIVATPSVEKGSLQSRRRNVKTFHRHSNPIEFIVEGGGV
jgi:hypothetical protein